MPRQRMIKPEFFDSESLALCSMGARIAFIGLWVMGDDYGNQKAQMSRLKHRIFPYDSISQDEFIGYLCELEEVGCIKGYEIDGERYITVPNFNSYQTVRKPSSTNVPKPPKAVEKAKRTTVIHQWRTSGAPVTYQCGSDALVTHYDGTSVPERKKEGSKEVFTDFFANEYASDGADAAEAAPPSAPICPLCSSPLKMVASKDGIKWHCRICGDVKEPAFGTPREAS